MFRSIRWTLQLWHMAILLIAMSALGAALYLGVRREQLGRVDAQLEGAARVLATGPMGPPPIHQWPGADRDDDRPLQFDTSRESTPDGPPRDRPGAGGDDPRGGGHQGDGGGPDGGGHPGGGGLPPGPRNDQGPDFDRQWWSRVPRDALHRLGENERDQPYFAVWGPDGTLLRASVGAVNLPPPPQESTAQRDGSHGRGGSPDPRDANSSLNVSSAPRDPSSPTDRSPTPRNLAHAPDVLPPPRPATPPAPQFRQRGDRREVIVTGRGGVRVLVGKSIEPELAALARLRWELLCAGAAVLAIGAAGGWLLGARVLRPIRAISRTAQSISASDLSGRISLHDTQGELGSLALTLNQTFDRLQSAFARQIRFTADASHELRTPLSIIHSHAELALGRERSTDEYRQTLQTCLRASRRMKSLVDSLLALARADAGKLELHRESFDLREAAQECLDMLQPAAREHDISLRASMAPVTLHSDRTRIAQLLINLLSNAIRYNRAGGSIDLNISAQGERAIIRIADTGVGIAAEDQPRVFERFFRADKVRSGEAGASGLGLAICQSIVTALGGTIGFTSQRGSGSTFTVILPLPPGQQTES
jgi:heavy metal sensor kinase